MTETVLTIGGQLGVTCRFIVQEASVKFFAAEITATDDNGPLYWRKGSESNADPTPDLGNAERYLDGFVKWDGCAHYYFGDENGYLHLCDTEEVQQLGIVVAEIHRTCGRLMKETGQNIEEEEFDLC